MQQELAIAQHYVPLNLNPGCFQVHHPALTFALKAWMDRRCSEGWRLNRITSPSSKWRSTMYPT